MSSLRLTPLLTFIVLLAFSEWLFLATKPSFLSGLPLSEKFVVLLTATTGLTMVAGLLFCLLALLLGNLGLRGKLLYRFIVVGSTSLLATILLFLLIDNFAYTLFGIGYKVMTPLQKALVSFLAGLIFLQIFLKGWSTEGTSNLLPGFVGKKRYLALFASLFCLVTVFLLVSNSLRLQKSENHPATVSLTRPNVIIIGSDALEAGHMSVYGYDRNTTPFLLEKKHEFLIAENSFSNTRTTFGSIGALLTGKLPTTTRLYYPPNVLLGDDQYEHLPAIFMLNDYRSLDMSYRWYADPTDINLRNAFENSNFRTLYRCPGGMGFDYFCREFPNSVLLIESAVDRIKEKFELLTESTFVDSASNPLRRAGQPEDYWHSDEDRLLESIKFITDDRNRPFFLHMHLMHTHGPVYVLQKQVFSKGLQQRSDWQTDFYDDSILGMDEMVRTLYEKLRGLELLSNTVIVITSDHGREWNIEKRLPLMIRFPGGEHSGSVSSNTDRLDVAATLMDYLDWNIPVWMEGRSLLAESDKGVAEKPIFNSLPIAAIFGNNKKWIMPEPIGPFFYLEAQGIILCNLSFRWNLNTLESRIKPIEGHTNPCSRNKQPSLKSFKEMVKQHLKQRGYKIDSLEPQ